MKKKKSQAARKNSKQMKSVKKKPAVKNGFATKCEVCGFVEKQASERHCKLVCENCGATQDCSD